MCLDHKTAEQNQKCSSRGNILLFRYFNCVWVLTVCLEFSFSSSYISQGLWQWDSCSRDPRSFTTATAAMRGSRCACWIFNIFYMIIKNATVEVVMMKAHRRAGSPLRSLLLYLWASQEWWNASVEGGFRWRRVVCSHFVGSQINTSKKAKIGVRPLSLYIFWWRAEAGL